MEASKHSSGVALAIDSHGRLGSRPPTAIKTPQPPKQYKGVKHRLLIAAGVLRLGVTWRVEVFVFFSLDGAFATRAFVTGTGASKWTGIKHA
eukprot:3427741-Amphidinium_carterae.1